VLIYRLYRPAAIGAPLGPPLPGDLGKPILNAGAAPNAVTGGVTPDPEGQRRAQELEAARVSRLFSQTSQQSQGAGQLLPNPSAGTTTTPAATPPVDAGSAQNMQDRKTAFLNASTDKRTISPDRLEANASPYVVQAGTVIPAALITGIRSDLPGQITAQVTEAVYDSPTGKYLLIPQGAKLIGQYDSSVAFGQSRLLLVWTRIIMPDGASIVLERQPGADTQGYAGLEDEVDNHWGMLFKAAVLSTLLSVGAEAGTSQDENNLVQAIRSGASNSISRPASRSSSASSTSSRRSRSAPGSRSASSSRATWCWRPTARTAPHDEAQTRAADR
jgi:type IV secretion system protein VirB10